MKSYLVLELILGLILLSHNVSGFRRKFLYHGPDGCTGATCDCFTSDTVDEMDSEDNVVETTHKLTCKHYYTYNLSLPPYVHDLWNSAKEAFFAGVDRTKTFAEASLDYVLEWKSYLATSIDKRMRQLREISVSSMWTTVKKSASEIDLNGVVSPITQTVSKGFTLLKAKSVQGFYVTKGVLEKTWSKLGDGLENLWNSIA